MDNSDREEGAIRQPGNTPVERPSGPNRWTALFTGLLGLAGLFAGWWPLRLLGAIALSLAIWLFLDARLHPPASPNDEIWTGAPKTSWIERAGPVLFTLFAAAIVLALLWHTLVAIGVW
jgi:hypothetical protein